MGSVKRKVTGEWRRLHNGELMVCTSYQYYSGDQSKKEMDRARSTYGGEERCIQGFGGET
jgi:hypothetical protein